MNLRLRDTLTRSRRAGRAARGRPRPDVHVRPDGLPLRPRRQPADVPARRTSSAAALLYHGIDVLQVQNITDVGPPARRCGGSRGRPDARRRRPRGPPLARDRGRLRGRVPRRRGAREHPAGARLPAGDRAHRRDGRPGRAARDAGARLRLAARATSTTTSRPTPATARSPATRSTRCDAGPAVRGRTGQGRPGRLRPLEGRRPGRDLRWPSPWGEGFPGWHLECSAMALRHLGPTFDIHTGGEDNVFPHHEDEIAQSAPIVGGPPAALWVHGAHLLMSGRKMSKSRGQLPADHRAGRRRPRSPRLPIPVPDLPLRPQAQPLRALDRRGRERAGLAPRGASPALGPAPRRGPWAPPAPLRAGASPDRPAGLRRRAHGPRRRRSERASSRDRAGSPAAPLSTAGRALHDRFAAAVDDDLDMPVALRIARETLRAELAGGRAALARARHGLRARSRSAIGRFVATRCRGRPMPPSCPARRGRAARSARAGPGGARLRRGGPAAGRAPRARRRPDRPRRRHQRLAAGAAGLGAARSPTRPASGPTQLAWASPLRAADSYANCCIAGTLQSGIAAERDRCALWGRASPAIPTRPLDANWQLAGSHDWRSWRNRRRSSAAGEARAAGAARAAARGAAACKPGYAAIGMDFGGCRMRTRRRTRGTMTAASPTARRDGTRGLAEILRDGEVGAGPEAVEHAIEVALRQAVAFGRRRRRPGPRLAPRERQVRARRAHVAWRRPSSSWSSRRTRLHQMSRFR